MKNRWLIVLGLLFMAACSSDEGPKGPYLVSEIDGVKLYAYKPCGWCNPVYFSKGGTQYVEQHGKTQVTKRVPNSE